MQQRASLPGGVWALGFVSLLMDVSSEMIHSLLPVFMVTVLGSSALTVGLIEGAALGMGLVFAWASDFRAVFWVAVLPGLLSVAVLAFGVREPADPAGNGARRNPLTRENLRRMPAAFWAVVAFGAVFTLARFSEAFLVLRAQQGGAPLAAVPLVLIVMNIVYALSAYPFGRMADRLPHRRLLAWGLLPLIAADALLATSAHWGIVGVGVALWGLHMGMTQGLLAAMVADASPADLRGTGFGLFNLVSGVAMLLASAIAGALWDVYGAPVTFIAGGAFALLSLAGLIAFRRVG